MSDDLESQIWEEDGRAKTYSPEAAADYLSRQGNLAIIVFIERGATRQHVVDVLTSKGLQVEVSDPWPTLSEKPGIKGLSIKKVKS